MPSAMPSAVPVTRDQLRTGQRVLQQNRVVFMWRVVLEKTCRFHFMSMHYRRPRAGVFLFARERKYTSFFLSLFSTVKIVFKVYFRLFCHFPSSDAKVAEEGGTHHIGRG